MYITYFLIARSKNSDLSVPVRYFPGVRHHLMTGEGPQGSFSLILKNSIFFPCSLPKNSLALLYFCCQSSYLLFPWNKRSCSLVSLNPWVAPIKPFLRFSKKHLKSKIVLNLLWSDVEKKSHSRDRENTSQQNFHGLKTKHQDTFWCLLKQSHFLHLLSLNKNHGLKGFRDLFEIKRDFFYSCIFPFPYIMISRIGIRSSMTDLAGTKFMLNRFSSFWFIVPMEISITLRNTFNQTSLNHFWKNWCTFHIDQSKGRFVKRQLWYVWHKTVSNHHKTGFKQRK